MVRMACGVLAASLLSLACGSSSTPSADVDEDVDAPNDQVNGDDGGDIPDGGDIEDAPDSGEGDGSDTADVPSAARTVLSLTAGGGAAASPSYQLQLSIGAPHPMGTRAADNHALGLGPGAVLHP